MYYKRQNLIVYWNKFASKRETRAGDEFCRVVIVPDLLAWWHSESAIHWCSHIRRCQSLKRTSSWNTFERLVATPRPFSQADSIFLHRTRPWGIHTGLRWKGAVSWYDIITFRCLEYEEMRGELRYATFGKFVFGQVHVNLDDAREVLVFLSAMKRQRFACLRPGCVDCLGPLLWCMMISSFFFPTRRSNGNPSLFMYRAKMHDVIMITLFPICVRLS